MCVIVHSTVKNKSWKEIRIKFDKTMAVSVLICGCESWVIINQTQTSEKRFLRRTKGCTSRDSLRNEEIRNELEILSVNDTI